MNPVGTIHGRKVLEGSAEWVALLSAVTADALPDHTGASPRIIDRLHERRRELRKPYHDAVSKMSDAELAAVTNIPWQDRAKQREAERRGEEAERQFRRTHRAKCLPGLKRLLQGAVDGGDRLTARIVEDMISQHEAEVTRRAEAKRQAELLATHLAAERERFAKLGLEELLQERASDPGVGALLGRFIIVRCTTVARIADRVLLSESAVRRYLKDLQLGPCYTEEYTVGSGHHRRDVTAYYYRPDVIPAVLAEIARRDVERQEKRRSAAVRREERQGWEGWMRASGFRKPKA